MTQADLKNTLRSMVQEHGAERVSQTLNELEIELKGTLLSMVRTYGFDQVKATLMSVETSQPSLGDSPQRATPVTGNGTVQNKRRGARYNATQYVAKMDLEPDRSASVVKLADRFDDKTFLPTFGDIANFCEIYGIDVPASRSRASAIPRVFKFLASMEPDDIEKIVKWEMFSGPSRLGPIADAIRRNGRAARASETEAGVSSG